MASFSVKFRPSSLPGRAGIIYYQIIHHRMVRQINSHYPIFPSEWSEQFHTVILPDNLHPRYPLIRFFYERIPRDLTHLQNIEHSLKTNNIDYTTDEIVTLFLRQTQERMLLNFSHSVIDQLKQRGKVRTLQAIYNRAIAQGLAPHNHPFKQVYTGIDKTIKRAISLTTIKRIKDLDLSNRPALQCARDLFLFSFYTRGMSFVDMAYLRKRDLREGILSYHRRKTNQPLYIKWESCMQEILDRYPTNSTEYLLPIITNPKKDSRKQYLNARRKTNSFLKEVSHLLQLSPLLTTYIARHSWASIARSKKIPISVISEGMGHDSETTTQIYLASLDNTIIEQANQLILNDLQ